MPEFDPYHKWFGIRAEFQPADHYRLLGIETFESDPDIIESAAEQRMTYLQAVANGPHVETAQRLLNEVSSARVVLLNDEQRQQYDNQLRRQRTADEHQTSGQTSVERTTNEASSTRRATTKRASKPKRASESVEAHNPVDLAKRTSDSERFVWIGAGLCGSVIVIAGLILLLSGGDTDPDQEGSVARKSSSSKQLSAQTSAKTNSKTPELIAAKTDESIVGLGKTAAKSTVAKSIAKSTTKPVTPKSSAATSKTTSDPPNLRLVIQALSAKEKPRGIQVDVLHFVGPPGNGRRGANGIFVSPPNDDWKTGTEWSFEYARSGSARGVHIVHPFGNGHVTVNLLPNDANLDPSGRWRGYLAQPKHPRQKTLDYPAAFPFGGPAKRIISRLDHDGGYSLLIDGKLVLTSNVRTAAPLNLPNTFKGAGLPLTWPARSAGLIMGPRDKGANIAMDVRFGSIDDARLGP